MPSNITIDNGSHKFPAYLSPDNAERLRPGLILIHEVWGLTDNIREVADRFAGQDYLVLAPDLLSETDITEQIDQSILAEVANPDTRAEAQKKMRAAMAPLQVPEFAIRTIEKLQQCSEFLKERPECNGKIAVVGFCFGGTYAYNLLVHERGLSAAVAFYGYAPHDLESIGNINCPILAFYGEKDTNLLEQLPALSSAMNKHKKDFRYEVYPNAGHAFFNDTNPVTYNKDAALEAWEKTLNFLKEAMS